MNRRLTSTKRAPRRRAGGFTLVEVLVALAIMALIAGMAWQGLDAVLRTRDASTAAVDRTLRLQTVLAQCEADLAALHRSRVVPALAFDGATLRLTRTTADGVQLVAWTQRDGRWWRWASPATTRVSALQESWLRSQQLLGNEPGTLAMLEGAQSLQVYFYRNNAWTNAQSAGDPAAPPPAIGASGAAARANEEALPTGVRIELGLASGTVRRDIVLAPRSL